MLVEYKGRMVEIIEISRLCGSRDGLIISANYLDDNTSLEACDMDLLALERPELLEPPERLLDDGL
jgi:hypothetical protein